MCIRMSNAIPMARTALRASALVLLLLTVSACGKSTVVRTPGGATVAGQGAGTATGQPGASVVVQRGDTLYSIARRNNAAVADLARWNGLQPPYTIYPGQRLALGAGGRTGAGAPAGAGNGRTPAPRPSTPPPASAPAPRPAPVAVASNVRWQWPAQGVVLSGYVEGNATRQGVAIGGSSGQAVNAAADGVVVYSGAGLVGYGELIIVKHNDQWLSAYGHNRKRLVNEGQAVKAGQQIAEMGRTGTDRDKLHFEIRYNGKPVDPLLYLPKR